MCCDAIKMRPRTEFETGPLLGFRVGEGDFRSTVELARPYSLDLALFGVHAAMVSTGVGYIRSGGASAVAVRFMLFILYIIFLWHIYLSQIQHLQLSH